VPIDTYPPQQLATANSVLGYKEDATAALTTSGGTELEIISIPIFVQANRTLRLTHHEGHIAVMTAGEGFLLRMYEDAVVISTHRIDAFNTAEGGGREFIGVAFPAQGQHTYKVTVQRIVGAAGTLTFDRAGTDIKAFLLIEDITGGTGGPGPINLSTISSSNDQTISAAGPTILTDLTAPVNVPAGRSLRVFCKSQVQSTVGAGNFLAEVYEDGVSKGRIWIGDFAAASNRQMLDGSLVVFPTPGPHTYDVRLVRFGGSGSLVIEGSAGGKQISVEDITGTLAPGTGYVDDTGWLAPTLLNGWTLYSDGNYAIASMYRKRLGVVYLRGLLNSVSASNGVAFNLPAGFRPGGIVRLFSAFADNGANRYDVQLGGDVAGPIGRGWVSFAGIQFIADQ